MQCTDGPARRLLLRLGLGVDLQPHGPTLAGEGEHTHFPRRVFFDVDLRHHERVDDLVAADHRHQVDLRQQNRGVTKKAYHGPVGLGLLIDDKPPVKVGSLGPTSLRRRDLLVGVGLFLVFVWVFGDIAAGIPSGRYRVFDETILRAFRTDADPGIPRGPSWIQPVMQGISVLGSGVVLTIVVVGFAAYLGLHRRWRVALTITLVSAGGTILDVILKALVSRPRPSVVAHLTEVTTSSFPSGHTLLSAVIYLSVGTVLVQNRGVSRSAIFVIGAALLLTLSIGISRLYLGVHYPTDVLAGWATGGAWTLLCMAVQESVKYRRAKGAGSEITFR